MSRPVSEIDIDLAAAYTARRTAMSAQEYTMDSGQGRQSVKRASLTDINKTIRELQAEREQSLAEESGGSGIISGSFQRYC